MRATCNEAINIQKMTFNMIKIVTTGDLCEKKLKKICFDPTHKNDFPSFTKNAQSWSHLFERRLRITSVRVEAKGDFQVHEERETRRRTRNERNEGIPRLAREIEENGRG